MGDKDLVSQQEARDAVDAAYLAFQSVAKFDQAKIDEICEAMASSALADSLRLGQMAHDETGFGKPEDKREKNRFAAEDLWNYCRGLKTVGVISESDGIVEIASPRAEEERVRRKRAIHEKERSTTQRLGNRTKPCLASGSLTTSK